MEQIKVKIKNESEPIWKKIIIGILVTVVLFWIIWGAGKIASLLGVNIGGLEEEWFMFYFFNGIVVVIGVGAHCAGIFMAFYIFFMIGETILKTKIR